MKRGIPETVLHDGLHVPVIGFGTVYLRGNQGAHAIQSAIQNGYRFIDTAYNYENEATVGEAIRRSAIPREELLISSKLPGRYHAYNDAITTIQESLYRAQFDYYDLYLIHWPNPKQDQYVEAWQALIDAKKWGLIRSIGVSNFLPEHLERLKKETGILPSVNQIELHPHFNQEAQRKWHKEHEVTTQSWSPLLRGQTVLQDKTINNIAAQHEKTVSQVILRWHYQLESISIPRSSSPQRQLENLSIFDFSLTDTEMDMIHALTREDGRIKDQDPATYEEF